MRDIPLQELESLRAAGISAILDDIENFSDELKPEVRFHCNAAMNAPINKVFDLAAVFPLPWPDYPTREIQMVMAGIAMLAGSSNHPKDKIEYRLDTAGDRALPEGAPLVLCVTGHTQSGKDEVIDFLRKQYSGVEKVALSTPIIIEANNILKSMTSVLPDFDEVAINADSKNYFPYRHLLQTVGDCRRLSNLDYWLSSTIRMVRELQREGASLIGVVGARTENEVSSINRLFGADVWRTKRPNSPYKAPAAIEKALDHLPDCYFDAVIMNDREGDLDRFHRNIQEVVDQW